MADGLRHAKPSDTDGAIRVLKVVYAEYGFTWDEAYMEDVYNLEAHYLHPEARFWVYELEGEVVGTCALELFRAIPGELGSTVEVGGRRRAAGCDCSVERLYVLPSARGHGVGSQLMERCISEARGCGRQAMEIWSDKKLVLAHRLYEKLGAVRVGERICHDPDQSPEWGMALKL